ncbi:MAG: ATP-dependent Clp protease proteolytic subunit, partial [Planctomycetota bacterium]
LVGGTKGKRFCLPNSRVMMHQPMGGVQGQVSDIEIQAAEMFRYRDRLNHIIAEHCGKSVEEIAKDTDRDFFLSADQAIEYGLVDDLLQKPPSDQDDDDDDD